MKHSEHNGKKSRHGLAVLGVAVIIMAVILGLAYQLRTDKSKSLESGSQQNAPSIQTATGPSDPKQFVTEFIQAFRDGDKEKVNRYISQNTNDEKAFEGKDNYFDYCTAAETCSSVLKNTKFDAKDQDISQTTFSDATGVSGIQLRHRKAAETGEEVITFYLIKDATTWRFYRFDYSLN